MDKILALELTERKEIEELFKNLLQGLKMYSVAEMNEGISKLINRYNNQETNKQIVDAVLETICDDFDISRSLLLKGRGKGKVQDARRYAYCILHFDLGFPIRFIARNIFFHKWHTSVSVVIQYCKSLNKDVKVDREFYEKWDALKLKIDNRLKYDKV